MNNSSLERFVLLQMFDQGVAMAGYPLCPLDIAPKYDKENIGCELSS